MIDIFEDPEGWQREFVADALKMIQDLSTAVFEAQDRASIPPEDEEN